MVLHYSDMGEHPLLVFPTPLSCVYILSSEVCMWLHNIIFAQMLPTKLPLAVVTLRACARGQVIVCQS